MTREEAKVILALMAREQELSVNNDKSNFEALNMAIKALEQKAGHWRHYEGMLMCSECETEFYDDIMEYCGDDVPRYCPNCGAKMESEASE